MKIILNQEEIAQIVQDALVDYASQHLVITDGANIQVTMTEDGGAEIEMTAPAKGASKQHGPQQGQQPRTTGIQATQDSDEVPETDADGLPWDERIHSSGKALNTDGTWRKKRGVEASEVAAVEAELKGESPAPAAEAKSNVTPFSRKPENDAPFETGDATNTTGETSDPEEEAMTEEAEEADTAGEGQAENQPPPPQPTRSLFQNLRKPNNQ